MDAGKIGLTGFGPLMPDPFAPKTAKQESAPVINDVFSPGTTQTAGSVNLREAAASLLAKEANAEYRIFTPFVSEVGTPPPIAAPGGKLICPGTDGTISALDCKTGRMLWEHKVTNQPWVFFAEKATVSPDGTKLYAPHSMGETKILNLEDGSEAGKKSNNPPNGMSTPVFSPDGKTVYHGQFNRGFYADKTDLHFYNWQEPGIDLKEKTAPAVSNDGKMVFLTSSGDTLTAMDSSNGRIKWLSDVSKFIIRSSPAALKDGSVAAVDEKGTIVCFNGETGKKKWSLKVPIGDQPVKLAEMAVDDKNNNIIAVMKQENDYKKAGAQVIRSKIASVDASSGKLNWKMETEGFVGTPCLSEDGKTLYLGFADGRLAAFDSSTGNPVWSIDKPGTKYYTPGLSEDGNTLYCGLSTQDPLRGKISELAAFDAHTGQRIDSFKTQGNLKPVNNYEGAVTYKASDFSLPVQDGGNAAPDKISEEKKSIVKKQGSIVIGGVALPVREQ
ncbi:MAG: PQQ-binding-like beta-propeller repeat protein [Firmicutes bacterium]|nr:PQQ-binding-like beta-propeller repeat protein [Bacillota bacterium]